MGVLTVENVEITAEYLHTTHRWDDTRIVDVAVRNGQPAPTYARVKIHAADDELVEGTTYRWFGRWTTHPRYGQQFHAQSFTETTPHDRDGVVRYLQRAPGIGPVTARLLWDLFGDGAVGAVRTSPGETSDLVRRDLHDAAVWLADHQATEDCVIDLVGLLGGRGFPTTVTKAAMQTWGNRAAEIIRRNPFRLSRFRGAGFARCDQLYLNLGRPPGKLRRQVEALLHGLATDRTGHTWFATDLVERDLRAKISGATPRPVKAVRLGRRARRIATHRDDNGRLWIAARAKADNEAVVAHHVVKALAERPTWPSLDAPAFDGLSTHQRDRLAVATTGVLGVLCGSPGTGKTFTACTLARVITDTYGADSLAVAAPTGKAAVRITELMLDHGVEVQATTIHRLLVVRSRGEGGWGFLHSEHLPLPQGFIIIDESSMIDTDLMASLLRARAPGTHILFVGDTNQLPPVGHGKPLADMIDAHVPTGELRDIRRNAGTIVRACAAIRDGRRFQPDPILDPSSGRNLLAVPTRDTATAADKIVKLINDIGDHTGLDRLWDVQVVVAVNRNSALSRTALNARLQHELNPNGRGAKSSPFKVGDKIICTKNHMVFLDIVDRSVDAGGGKAMVCNGEIGVVTGVESRLTYATFDAPRRHVKIPRGASGDGGDDGADSDARCHFDLAYAITVHKSQGSEWPVVIVALDDCYGSRMVCDRAWIYTAISRAKRACFLVGRVDEAYRMIGRQSIDRRKTFLSERIREMG
jgi:exodeoxyribonuclease V alpha subunit